MAEEEQDFSKLPLEERCHHKNWKARVSAYEELIKTFQRIDDEKSSEWSKYASWVRKFPTDANAAAQEKALEATLAFFENVGMQPGGRIVAEVMSGIVAKCITAAKAKSKELAVSISLVCVEIEKFETVQDELMKGMEQKNPKVVAGCINIVTEILRNFGVKVLNLKTILKKVTVLTEDRDKGVREDTKKLMVELYRWLGPGIKPQLSAVKTLVLQDVEAEVEKISEKPHQIRFLRSQQVREAKASGDAGDIGEAAEDVGEEESTPDVDPYDLLDPVDILSKLPKDFYEKCEAKKWQDRKGAMETLETLVSSPKLEVGDYSDLVRMLKRLIGKDNNVVVVALAGKCLAGLANGLKKKFSPYAASCISTILEKFKEKKANVVAALRDAIDACFVATTLESIQEDVIQALQNKNPSIKIETGTFLARVFAKTPFKIMSDKKLMKPFFTAIVGNLNESDPNVRDSAAEAFGVALKHLGEKPLGSFTADMDAIKLQKVKEYAEKVVITAPKEKKAPAKPVSQAKTSNAGPRIVKPEESKKPVVRNVTNKTAKSPAEETGKSITTPKPTSRSVPQNAKNPPGKTGARKNVSGGTAASTKPVEEIVGSHLPANKFKAQRISDEMKLRILKWNFVTPREEFIELLKDLMANAGISQTLITNMFNSNFKLHLKAVDTLQEEFNAGMEGTICNLDLILKWTTLRFFDTNPSVLLRILDYLTQVFSALGGSDFHLSEVEASAFVPYLLIKIGDPKENVRSLVHGLLKLICKVYPVQKVAAYLLEGLRSKNARQRTDCMEELGSMVSLYGLTIFSPSAPQALKEIAKQISDRDNGVRNAALNCVVQAFHIEGDRVYKMIGNLADKDQSLLEERIKRAAKSRPPPVVPTAPAHHPGTSRLSASNANGPSSAGVNGHSAESPVKDVSTHGAVSQPTLPAVSSPEENHADAGCDLSADIPRPPERNPAFDKYRIDFQDIDNMFSDNKPIPPLQLLDTNIENFMRGENISLPKRRAMNTPPLTSRVSEQPPDVPLQANQSIDLVVSQMSDANLRRAMEACVKLEKMLIDPETSVIMSCRVDSILGMLVIQMRRILPTIRDSSAEELVEVNRFLRCAVTVLNSLFKGDFLPKRATKETLKDIIQNLLVLIVDENIEKLSDASIIIKLINVMVVRIVEISDPSAITCGLIRLMTDTLANTQLSQTRVLELVMKCQWKLLKQYKVWSELADYEWDVRGILNEYHHFVTTHPFSSFQSRDATPLKTIKTLMHGLMQQVGCESLQYYLNTMPELRESEAGIYLHKTIQREISKPRSGTNSGSLPLANENVSQANNNVNTDFLESLPDPKMAPNDEAKMACYMERLNLLISQDVHGTHSARPAKASINLRMDMSEDEEDSTA